jgi:hypothetical protein
MEQEKEGVAGYGEDAATAVKGTFTLFAAQ